MQLAHREPLGRQVQQDPRVQPARKVQPESQVRPAHEVRKDPKAPPALQVLWVPLVLKGHKEFLE